MVETPFFVGQDAVSELLLFCKERNYRDFVLVSDENTYAVLGSAVEKAIQEQGLDLISIVLKGGEVIADARRILETMLELDRKERIFLAVGSGTITDITRFVSHRTRTRFIALPTAASVDGFNSTGAPLVVEGLKKTYFTHGPIALFADLPTLANAPRLLNASGYGDLMGKLVSVADWKLGHILWGERFDESIEKRTLQAAMDVAPLAKQIGAGEPEAIRLLMRGLVQSGVCMLDFGNSAPASGGEHHMSHYWEMLLLEQHKPAIFHGVKVGIASIISAGWYRRITQTSRSEVEVILQKAHAPDFNAEKARISARFGKDMGKDLIVDQLPLINVSAAEFAQLKTRIIEGWDEVQALARRVPQSDELAKWLGQAGAPTTGEAIGISAQEIEDGKAYGHYLRKRFTINKLRLLLGWE